METPEDLELSRVLSLSQFLELEERFKELRKTFMLKVWESSLDLWEYRLR